MNMVIMPWRKQRRMLLVMREGRNIKRARLLSEANYEEPRKTGIAIQLR